MKCARFFYWGILIALMAHAEGWKEPFHARPDDFNTTLLDQRVKGSHISVFFPTMPYLYVSKLINGTLVRSSDNENGWEYMMATSHRKIDDLTYELTLRHGVLFQNGTPFNADSVVENFAYFMQDPVVYSDIHKRLRSVEKVDAYTIRIHLNKPYGLLFSDLTSINLYPSEYLKRYGWSTKEGSTCNSMQAPGPWGLGPYRLEKGYATGRYQTPILELVANENYYEKGLPYIEKITVYTELTSQEAVRMALEEGTLDITPIPFNKKVETVLSTYARLVTKPSLHNISIYFNLLKPDSRLKDQRIRIALNQAINQENLLNFVYKNEGVLAPSEASPNYRSIKRAITDLPTWGQRARNNAADEEKALKQTLEGLHLKVITMDRFMFLWHGIEHQLKRYGVSLEYTITPNEKVIYEQLLTNRESPKTWDILTWGNDDWSSNNPWTAFFAYRVADKWSAMDRDDVMQTYIEQFFDAEFQSESFYEIVSKIVHRAYEKAYMLAVPAPNIVLAVNKEVSYEPSSVLLMPLWKAKITKYHRSIATLAYPKEREAPLIPLRFNYD